ncbi:MAG: glycosyltransferase family 9 protein [Candidatus Krumholzibacteriia bacterium]
MGVVKRMERAGKRFLIRLTTALVRTEALPKEAVLSPTPSRILVIRQHNQMGDMLLAVPAYRAIKETCPGAELGVVCARINRDVLLNNPYVDRVHTFAGLNPLRVVLLVRRLRRCRYDLAIVLHTVSFSFTSAMLGLLSGARYRVGSTSRPFHNRMSSAFYHLELPLPGADELDGMNEAEHNLYPLGALGIRTADIRPVLVPTAANEQWADSYLRRHMTQDVPVVAVHPGAGKAGNIWPPEKLAGVVNRLAAAREIGVCVIEGPRDAGPVRAFCGVADTRCVTLKGRPIGDVAAVLRRARLVICNDTGVMHVSSAAGATTLGIFGPTDPVRWAPRCPNLHVVRAEHGRLSELKPETVYERARALLDASP